MPLYYTLFFGPVHERKSKGKARDSDIAEEYLELREVKCHYCQQHSSGQHSRNKYFVTGEYPQADYYFDNAESVQEHEVRQVALHKRRKVSEPRIRVAEKRR